VNEAELKKKKTARRKENPIRTGGRTTSRRYIKGISHDPVEGDVSKIKGADDTIRHGRVHEKKILPS